MELSAVAIEVPENGNVIIGQAHFIKTVEDLHETLAVATAGLRFGVAFCEASGPCLVRRSGNDLDLVKVAARNAEAIGCGHSFVVVMTGGYPVSVLNDLKLVPEVCTVYCATGNALQVIVAETDLGRAILGVVDGLPPAGIEDETAAAERHDLLRRFGYKL